MALSSRDIAQAAADKARGTVKRRPDDRALGETDYAQGWRRASQDKMSTQPRGKGANIPTLPRKWPYPVKRKKVV